MYEVASVRLQLELQPVAILCDYQRMVEVVTNLMTNALKYTRAGGTVTVETGQCDLGGPLLRITDTGIGIPADELPRVTERFFRGADSSSIAAGSGIGLTIVSQLVRAQRGSTRTSRSEPVLRHPGDGHVPERHRPGGCRAAGWRSASSYGLPAGKRRPVNFT